MLKKKAHVNVTHACSAASSTQQHPPTYYAFQLNKNTKERRNGKK